MSTHDANGIAYARYSQLKPGDKVKVDAGFTCLPEGAVREVKRDGISEEFYIDCNDGMHLLDGQRSFEAGCEDSLVGIYPV